METAQVLWLVIIVLITVALIIAAFNEHKIALWEQKLFEKVKNFFKK